MRRSDRQGRVCGAVCQSPEVSKLRRLADRGKEEVSETGQPGGDKVGKGRKVSFQNQEVE